MAAITHYHSFCFRIYRPVGSDMGHNNINTTRSMYPIIDHYKSNIKSPLDGLLTEEDEI